MPQLPVQLVSVAAECAEADEPQHGDNGIHGVDCSVCYDKAKAGTAIAGNLTGVVGLLMAEQVFCFAHWLDIARVVQAAGAVSCAALGCRSLTQSPANVSVGAVWRWCLDLTGSPVSG